MTMPGRKYSQANTKYRYGFNGKENDNEVKGEGNQQDYGMRIYDPRIGRFLSVDPIMDKYPFLTPYQFASNRCIQGIDLDGLEVFLVTGTAGFFAGIAGLEGGIGFAIGKDGLAVVPVADLKLGLGLEVGASVNFTLFPTLKGVSSLIPNRDKNGKLTTASLDYGVSASAAWIAKVGAGVSKEGDDYGGTASFGPGLGGHVSFDISLPTPVKVISWDEIVNEIKVTTEQNKVLQKVFGINEKNIGNSKAIIQDYFVKMATTLRDKRIAELNTKNSDNQRNIKAANTIIEDYKTSNAFYKLFKYADKTTAEVIKKSSEKNTSDNNKEIEILKNTEIKF